MTLPGSGPTTIDAETALLALLAAHGVFSPAGTAPCTALGC